MHRFVASLRSPLLSVLLLTSLALVACSHSSPYIRKGLAPIEMPAPDSSAVQQRLLLIGDAGTTYANDATLAALQRRASERPDHTTIVYLGDNIYPSGLPAPDERGYDQAADYLQAQIDVIAKSGASGFFIPGNHDWDSGKRGGLERVRRQEAFVNQALPGAHAYRPANGCPGPEIVDLEETRLIVLDSHWWLHRHDKPIAACFEGAVSEQAAKDSIMQRVAAAVATAGERQIIVLTHHPLDTHGPHGGFYDWQDHIFPLTNLASWAWVPLPVVGSLYPLGRSLFVRYDQDLQGPRNQEFRRRLQAALQESRRPVIYASGHEHSLQVLQGDGAIGYLLVSGAGAEKKGTKVGHGDNTLFAHAHPGFMELEVLADGRIYLRVFEPNAAGQPVVAFARWLRR